MNGLQLAVGESTLSAFLLAVARTAGFVFITPPFNSRAVPVQARVSLVIALALVVLEPMRAGAPALASSAMLIQIVLQAAMGLALGFLVLAAVAAVQAAG